MSHYIITGTFKIVASSGSPYQPDGDTIRFQFDDPALIDQLEKPDEPAKNPPSIRFEAIDALEKEQDETWAKASRDRMFELLGLAQTSLSLGTGDQSWSVLSANLSESRGYIIANALDKHGRVIAFVYPGDPVYPDGAAITPTVLDIQSSVNRTLIVEGLVYPTFYSGLEASLRTALANDAQTARAGPIGLWPHAVGMPGSPVNITSPGDLSSLVLFPTLHRRVRDYLDEGNSDFNGFAAWVRSPSNIVKENKKVLILADNTETDLPGIVSMSGYDVGLLYQPEDFVLSPWSDPVVPDLVIVGVLANAVEDPELGSEVVTLLNTTGAPINLAGWYLRDNAGPEDLDATITIDAGHTRRIIPQALQLGNKNDKVELYDPHDVMIDQVAWTEKAPEGSTLIFPWPRV